MNDSVSACDVIPVFSPRVNLSDRVLHQVVPKLAGSIIVQRIRFDVPEEIRAQRRQLELLQTVPDHLQTIAEALRDENLARRLCDNNGQGPLPPAEEILCTFEQHLMTELRLAARPRGLQTGGRRFMWRESGLEPEFAIVLQTAAKRPSSVSATTSN